jgi:hypothetical protein
VSYEYILAGLIIILVMNAVQIAVTDLLSQRLTALEEQNLLTEAEKVADVIFLSPGNPVNWGNTPAQEPTFFGLAAASSLRAYTLDPYKIMRLMQNSTGYISPTRARELLGLSPSSQFSLKFTPLMDINVAGNGVFTITVKDRMGVLDANVNITSFYVPKSLSIDSTYSSVTNITRLDGTCMVSFQPQADYVLVVLAEQSAGKSLVTFPQGYDFKVEGGRVFQSDVPSFTEIDYSTGSFSGTTATMTYRYVMIDGLTYVAQFELME